MLDHNVYPHIWDLILASADHDSWFYLRGVTKDLKQRADAVLFSHLEYGALDDAAADMVNTLRVMRSPHGRLPGPPLPPNMGEFGLHPDSPDEAAWRPRLRLMRVLDLNAMVPTPMNYREGLLGYFMGRTEFVRRRWKTNLVMKVVATEVEIVDDLDGRVGFQVGNTHVVGQKHVVNFHYDPWYPELHDHPAHFMGTLEHAVFIFTPVERQLPFREPKEGWTRPQAVTSSEKGGEAPGDGGGPLEGDKTRKSEKPETEAETETETETEPQPEIAPERVPGSASVFGSRNVKPLTNPATGRPLPVALTPLDSFLHDLLAFGASGRAQRVTFVGLAQMERYILGLDPAFDDTQVELALQFAARALAARGGGLGQLGGVVVSSSAHGEAAEALRQERIESALAGTRFVSRDEYRAEVGEKVWEMETGFVPWKMTVW